MRNEQSTSGELEDLVRCFVQLAGLELHVKTDLEVAESDLQGAEEEQINSIMAKIKDTEDELEHVTEMRRNAMRIIASYATEVNYHEWCKVKHSAMAMYTAFEAYQANNSAMLYNQYMELNNYFIERISAFINLNIPACASCFSDSLKGMGDNEVQA